MFTEFTLTVGFHADDKEKIVTFVKAMKEAGRELSAQAALMSGETPRTRMMIENNEIGTKIIKLFNGEDK